MTTLDPEERRRRSFLHRCLRTTKPPLEVLADVGVSHERFAEWTRDATFRRRLEHLVRHLRRVRELHLQIVAASAVTTLDALARDATADPKPLIRAACVDLIRLARDTCARPLASEPETATSTDPSTLFHPDLAPDEAEALARVERKCDADGRAVLIARRPTDCYPWAFDAS